MGQARARGQPVTVIIDATPTLTTDAAAALLRILQNVADEHGRDDEAEATSAVAS
jgi:hypothetical protein